MPRIRTFKPEFFRSPDTAKASHEARLLYMAMWSWADDFGIGETNLYGLLGFAFPDEDDFTVKDLQRLLKEVCGSYGVVFYEHRRRFFYAVPAWDDHQKTERRANRRNPGPADPDSHPDLRFGTSEEMRGTSSTTQGSSALGTGEQGNRGTGEQGTGRYHEPPPDPEQDFVDYDAPEHIKTSAHPPKQHPTNASRTVVRQVLGNANYPRTTVDRLATQVAKLARDHPDTLIREALTEWDQRPNCDKPEFLSTVLSDVLKRSRTANTTSGHDDKVNSYLAYANQPATREIEV